jgi:hypothetical protein
MRPGLRTACWCRGYQLLAQMGYREGEGIGRSVKGRAAPIQVSLKPGRTGLGIDEDRKRKQESFKAQQSSRGACIAYQAQHCVPAGAHALCMSVRGWHTDAKRRRGEEAMRSSYVSSRAASFADRQDERRLAEARMVGLHLLCRATSNACLICSGMPAVLTQTFSLCMQVCETLDRRKGMADSVMWPPPPPEPADEEQAAEEEAAQELHPWEDRPAAQKLGDVLQWLRSEHCYCVYCGCQVRTCTHNGSHAHHCPCMPVMVLSMVLCVLQYADATELESQCPGLTEGDH